MNTSSLNHLVLPPHVKNLMNKTFGSWLVVAFAGLRQRKRKRCAIWWCQCICGEQRQVLGRSLKEHTSKSCGCRGRLYYKEEFAVQQSYPFEYGIWRNMWYRCTNPHDTRFADYGGRGIMVVPRWKRFNFFIHRYGRSTRYRI